MKSKMIEFNVFDSLDIDTSVKLGVDWYRIPEFQFTGLLGEYSDFIDVEKAKRTPQYNRQIIMIFFFGKTLQIDIRLNKTGMSQLHKVPLEK